MRYAIELSLLVGACMAPAYAAVVCGIGFAVIFLYFNRKALFHG